MVFFFFCIFIGYDEFIEWMRNRIGIGVYKNKNSGFCFVLICELRFVGDGQKNIERCQVCKANPGGWDQLKVTILRARTDIL